MNKKNYVKILVFDAGPGLHSTEAKEEIFIPRHTTRPDGSGMGLTFCRGTLLTFNQEATIEVVQSYLFCGSAFEIKILLKS